MQPLVKLVQWDNMDRLWMMTLPVATIVTPASTTSMLGNLRNPPPVKIAAPASTTSKSADHHVKIVAPASTTSKLANLRNLSPAKVVAPENTTSKSGNPPNPLPANAAALGNTTT